MSDNTGKVKAFLIFDNSSFSVNSLENIYGHIDLFSLTSNWRYTNTVISALKRLGVETNVLDSARIVNDNISAYRDNFIEWASAIGDFKFNAKTLRQWLLLSDGKVSAWWFGLMSDKDPTKSSAFIKIVQVSVLLEQIKKHGSTVVVLALKDYNFVKKLKIIFNINGIEYRIVRPRLNSRELLQIIKDFLKRQQIGRFLYTFSKTLTKCIYFKKSMPPFKNRKKNFDNALLFFSYFPSLIKLDAEHGRFRNKFAVPLQDICESNNKTIVWIFAYGEFYDYSFKDAVEFAKKFIGHGEHIFFWQEFLNPKNLLKASWDYIKLTFIWRYLRKKLDSKIFDKITGNSFSAEFLLETLDESFYGGYYLNGIIQYEAFKNMFKKLSGFSHALYTCEMMGWEYAFNAAQRKEENIFPVIGYQDYSLSPYLLQLFHSKEELKFKSSSDGIPLPEIIASCGRIPQIMLEKYYGKIDNLETLRFAYLSKFMQSRKRLIEAGKGNKFILLVCTNIDMRESKATVSLIDAAYDNIKNEVEVWFKGHPALPIEKVFKELGITFNNHSYAFKIGPVSDFLIQCDAVFAGEGSVAIEALAFGCEVLVYLNPEMLNLSSLVGFEDLYWKVYDPDTLLEVINNIRSGNKKQNIEKKQNFVKEYWNLNPSLDGWKSILNLR